MRIILLALSLVLSFGVAAQVPCPPQGDAKTEKKQRANVLKNRSIALSPVDTAVSLVKLLAPGEDSRRFSSSSYVRLTGYLVELKGGGKESCNCATEIEVQQDIHIYIGQTPHAEKIQCMIAEVTPEWKRLHKATDLKSMTGKQVTVEGYLFYDEEHKGNAVNTCKKCTRLWRKTCWEIHPVCKIYLN